MKRASSPLALASAGDLPRVPARGQHTEQARRERLAWLRAETGAELAPLDPIRLAAERLASNVENLVGAVEVPVGVAGPLLFRGERVRGLAYAPIATTEGALVASITRGATALSRAGGVAAAVLHQRMTRVPAIVAPDLDAAVRIFRWVSAHDPDLREQAQRVSRHARVVAVEPLVAGRVVHVRLVFETGDAAGQNMTTACAWHACQWTAARLREDGIPFDDVLVDGNVSGDKKVNHAAFLAGRGIRVAAEAVLGPEVLRQVLKIDAGRLLRANGLLQSGALQIGMVGYSVNAANVVAGVFVATGQDVACVHESAPAHLELQPEGDGVRASLLLPGLVVGTVGGGTHLPAQRALLELMGCTGPGSAARLAEIVAGFALALDLSTLSAIATGEFAAAHERLGRNRPVRFFGREDLAPAFFQPAVAAATGAADAVVRSAERIERPLGSSIVTELTARRVSKLVGLFPERVRYETSRGEGRLDVLVKVKPLDAEVSTMVNAMAAACGPRVAAAHERFRDRTGFAGCHVRELAVYAERDPRFLRHAPRAWRIFQDPEREAYVLVLELLEGLELMDSADDTSGWTRAHLEAALRGIAEVHAIWLGREDALLAEPWIGHVQTAAGMAEMSDLWDALAAHAHEEFPELVGPDRLARLERLVATIPDWWPAIEAGPRTLVHDDFNPRNVAFRRGAGGPTLCAFDWELATVHLPQHDVAELLAFTLGPEAGRAEVDALVEVHRAALAAASGRTLPEGAWRAGFRAALRDLAVNRFGLYLMAHTFRHYAFMDRTVRTLFRLLDLADGAE